MLTLSVSNFWVTFAIESLREKLLRSSCLGEGSIRPLSFLVDHATFNQSPGKRKCDPNWFPPAGLNAWRAALEIHSEMIMPSIQQRSESNRTDRSVNINSMPRCASLDLLID